MTFLRLSLRSCELLMASSRFERQKPYGLAYCNFFFLCNILDDFGFEFARPEFYYYLNQTGVYTVDGTNDAEDYNHLRVNDF